MGSPQIERRYAPETIGMIPINNGRDNADVIRELAPTGEIVAHPKKHGLHAHETMFRRGGLDKDYFAAAEEFRTTFSRAHLAGKHSTIDLFRVRGAPNPTGSDAVATAREKIRMALRCFASSKSTQVPLSVTQSAVWFLIGCGDSLEEYAFRMRSNNIPMTPDRASGILVTACERLAIHYGIIRVSDVKEHASTDGFVNGKLRGKNEGYQEAKDIAILVSMKAKTPQEFLAEFIHKLEQKVKTQQERP